jgi:hypothetical protein
MGKRCNYSVGMAIFLGCVFAYLMTVIFLGIENRGNRISDDEHAPDVKEPGFDVSSREMADGKVVRIEREL